MLCYINVWASEFSISIFKRLEYKLTTFYSQPFYDLRHSTKVKDAYRSYTEQPDIVVSY